MSCYLVLGKLLHKKTHILASISVSILLQIILNPYCILDASFQLSYGGTIGIVLFYPIFCKEKKKEKSNINKIKDIIWVTISANLILFPIILYHYNTISITFIISNLLVSPIIGITIILGFVTLFISYVSMPIASILSIILQFLLNLLTQIAHIVGKLPLSQIYLPTPKIGIILFYYFLLMYFYLKKKEKISIKLRKYFNKAIILLLIISVICNLLFGIINKNLEIFFIDVGQGDSILIKTPKGKTILVDGGGLENENPFNIGKQILIPYLLDKGIRNLDYILISHFDSDHVRSEY